MPDFSFRAWASLATQLSSDFVHAVEHDQSLPNQISYSIEDDSEPLQIRRSARQAYFPTNLVKVAFDTRRVDQEFTLNPRANLQYWHRTDPFISDDDQKRLETLAKLLDPLTEIKNKYGSLPEYHQSYARILHETLDRTLKHREVDKDIFTPQINYLEQLVFARYRLSLEDIQKFSSPDLKSRLLSKDENMLRRGTFLADSALESRGQEKNLGKDGNYQILNDTLAQAIFGQTFRKPGESSTTRTITISITDAVND